MFLMKSVTYRLGSMGTRQLRRGWPVKVVMAAFTRSMYILPVCQMNWTSSRACMVSGVAMSVSFSVRAPRLPPNINMVGLSGSRPK